MILIKQASVNDIPVIEDILLDVVNWLNSTGNSLWIKEQVSWQGLSASMKGAYGGNTIQRFTHVK